MDTNAKIIFVYTSLPVFAVCLVQRASLKGGHTSFGLGWAGLGWAGLGWAGLGWAGLGWAGLGWLHFCFKLTLKVSKDT